MLHDPLGWLHATMGVVAPPGGGKPLGSSIRSSTSDQPLAYVRLVIGAFVVKIRSTVGTAAPAGVGVPPVQARMRSPVCSAIPSARNGVVIVPRAEHPSGRYPDGPVDTLTITGMVTVWPPEVSTILPVVTPGTRFTGLMVTCRLAGVAPEGGITDSQPFCVATAVAVKGSAAPVLPSWTVNGAGA